MIWICDVTAPGRTSGAYRDQAGESTRWEEQTGSRAIEIAQGGFWWRRRMPIQRKRIDKGQVVVESMSKIVLVRVLMVYQGYRNP